MACLASLSANFFFHLRLTLSIFILYASVLKIKYTSLASLARLRILSAMEGRNAGYLEKSSLVNGLSFEGYSCPSTAATYAARSMGVVSTLTTLE